MIVVIQCAGKKNPYASHLQKRDGRKVMKVMFVADPDAAPANATYAYARPDDTSDTGTSWRTVLREYNADPGSNPHGLLPAWQLYENPVYEILKNHCGLKRLYILSAGWGLITAGFLTPCYDITFKATDDEHKYKRRRKEDRYDDFCMLPTETTEKIIFFGGKNYVSLFCALTAGVKGSRHLWYNSKNEPDAPGCVLHRFKTTTKTNWHYECAKAFVEGRIQLAVS